MFRAGEVVLAHNERHTLEGRGAIDGVLPRGSSSEPNPDIQVGGQAAAEHVILGQSIEDRDISRAALPIDPGWGGC